MKVTPHQETTLMVFTMFNFFKKDYDIVDIDYKDGDAKIKFDVEGNTYILDLEWVVGEMWIEFQMEGDKTFNTTNLNHHFKILKTIHYIVHRVAKKITKKTGMKFQYVTFKSSDIRNGVEDKKSKELRDKFFLRYVKKDFPNCEVSYSKKYLIIKLNEKK